MISNLGFIRIMLKMKYTRLNFSEKSTHECVFEVLSEDWSVFK